MNLDLTGKTALVCGSTQGIGKATATELASMGANVVLMARNEEALSRVKSELPGNGKHDYIVADFSDPESVKEALLNYLSKTKTQFNILVNNTGGPAGGPIINADTSAFEKTFTQHLEQLVGL